MSWNLQQQTFLAAMGYSVYHRAGAPAAAAAVRVDEATPAPREPGAADRLHQALVRAAGGRDLSGLALPPLDRLRGDAAAKRALWPRLRALRRG